MIRFAVFLLSAVAAMAADSTSEVTVELYSDFQCPFCSQMAAPFHELLTKGVEGAKAKVVFRHFPLDFHANAPLAHQAAVAAGEQGKFWEMHDALFAHQNAMQREALIGYAKTLNLDVARFTKDLDSDKVKQIIERDKAEGKKLGVQGTPTFFVNGQEYSGAKNFDQLAALVRDEDRRKVAISEITDALMSRGPEGAPVTLEFFADLQSPVSRSASYVLDELMAKFPSKVRLQFRNFPLSHHPQAGLAHEGAMAAARQGHFWEVTNYLFDHQDILREQDLLAFAGRLGMDQTKIADILQQHRYAPRVDADLKEGFKRGVRGSPVLFVNSKRIDGVPSLATLTEYVEAELAIKR